MGKFVDYDDSVRVGKGETVSRPRWAAGGQAAYVTTSRPVNRNRYYDGKIEEHNVHANSTGTRKKTDHLHTEVFVQRKDGKYEKVVDVRVEQLADATVVKLNGAVIATVWK